jgi:uncharacterized surface protein with fasciclin (FAS1) repeats
VCVPQCSILYPATKNDNHITEAHTPPAAGLAPLLSAPGVKTVFAPTNQAFGALGNNTLAWITNDRNQQHLLTTLYYHITSGAATSAVLNRVSSLPTFDQGPNGAEVCSLSLSLSLSL